MLLKKEKRNKNGDEKDLGNNDWTSIKRDNKFRIVFNDKIVKTKILNKLKGKKFENQMNIKRIMENLKNMKKH